ncbi:hypothetical protein [Roseobacter sp. CCS2]|uniref:hypothetical protein n=1 Tax=Roseobacter sp. CCS2 TaxID=391593 RepID=UPI0000F3E3A2|nr:hypothetical protein [Roseobacter sp. CCS2]EBA12094.1 hypothetical protein RCCS2_12394 [Roseobacter sp. CCS2]
MKRLAVIAALCAGPVAADPLDLIDYDALFADKAADVMDVSETRSLLRIGDVTLIRDESLPRGYTGLDEGGQGAMGCFVSILATIESAMQACEAELPAAQVETQTAYRSAALAFYAENVIPPVDPELAQERYNALVSSQIEGARPFCSNLDLVTTLADRVFSPEGAEEISGMMATPRLPVANPCL